MIPLILLAIVALIGLKILDDPLEQLVAIASLVFGFLLVGALID